MGARFSAPVQTGPGAHPASCIMGTGCFLGVKSGWGVTLTPHPLLVPWSRKSRAISLLPLWTVQPAQSLSACTRMHFTLLYSRLIAISICSFLTLWCLVFHCEHTYFLALWPTERLGFCNYGCPFFHFDCLLSPSFRLHLPYMLLQIFKPSQSRSSPFSTSLRFSLRYFLNCPSLIRSYNMSSPFQSFLFNICYYVYIFI